MIVQLLRFTISSLKRSLCYDCATLVYSAIQLCSLRVLGVRTDIRLLLLSFLCLSLNSYTSSYWKVCSPRTM